MYREQYGEYTYMQTLGCKGVYFFHSQYIIFFFSLLSATPFSPCLFREFGSGSTNRALIDILLYSHHLSA